MDTITLVGPDGLSLILPGSFTEVPDRESAELPLVAAVDPEHDPAGFHPTVSVRVDAVSPQLVTIAQLCEATIARQVALLRHVVAVEVLLPVENQEDGRWVTSVYPGYDTTILELQYLTIRASRCLTLSVLTKASRLGPGMDLFRFATANLICEGAPSEIQPAAKSLPPMDAYGATQGMHVESLGDFGPRQPFTSAGPQLQTDDLNALKGIAKRRRRGREALLGAGLIEADGRLTGAGGIARDLLLDHRARLTAGLTEAGSPGPRRFQALATGSDVVVIADAPPGGPARGQTVDVVPSLTLAARVIRWLGLAPAWTFGIGDGDDLTVRIGQVDWTARMADPDAPAPTGSPRGLLRLWEQPWQLATLRTTKRFRNGPRFVQFLKTPEAGYTMVSEDHADESVTLTARPSAELLHDLLIVSGAVSQQGDEQSGRIGEAARVQSKGRGPGRS